VTDGRTDLTPIYARGNFSAMKNLTLKIPKETDVKLVIAFILLLKEKYLR